MKKLLPLIILLVLAACQQEVDFAAPRHAATSDIRTPRHIQGALPWPLAPPTVEEFHFAKACDLSQQLGFKKETDPPPPSINAISNQFAKLERQEAACQWAKLATRLVLTNHMVFWPESSKEGARLAWLNSIDLNPAYAYKENLLLSKLGTVTLIEPHPFSEQQIATIDLHYEYFNEFGKDQARLLLTNEVDQWHIAGDSSQYGMDHMVSVEIVEDGETDIVHIFGETRVIDQAVQLQPSVQAAELLAGLLPISNDPPLNFCCHMDFDWTMKFTYTDDSVIHFYNNQNNVLPSPVGGPIYVEIEGQLYLQADVNISLFVQSILAMALDDPALDAERRYPEVFWSWDLSTDWLNYR